MVGNTPNLAFDCWRVRLRHEMRALKHLPNVVSVGCPLKNYQKVTQIMTQT